MIFYRLVFCFVLFLSTLYFPPPSSCYHGFWQVRCNCYLYSTIAKFFPSDFFWDSFSSSVIFYNLKIMCIGIICWHLFCLVFSSFLGLVFDINLGKFSGTIVSNISLFLPFFHYVYVTPCVVVLQPLDLLFCFLFCFQPLFSFLFSF